MESPKDVTIEECRRTIDIATDLDIVTAKVHDVHVMFVKPIKDFAPLKYGDWEKAESDDYCSTQ